MAKIARLNVSHFEDPTFKAYNRDSIPAVQVGTVGGYACAADPTGTARRWADVSDLPAGDFDIVMEFPDFVGCLRVGSGAGTYEVQGSWKEIDGDAGSGARTVAITVTDGTDPIALARVRVTKGSESFLQETDVNGLVTFNLNDGDWIVAASASGYVYAGSTLTVNGDETTTIEMDQVVIPSTDPDTVTGYWLCLSSNGTAQAGVFVYLEVFDFPENETGKAYDSTVRSDTSGVDGIVQFANLYPGVTYRIRRGDSKKAYSYTIPSDATGSVAMGSIIGYATP